MICQNQSIDESSAPLAKDLRLLIREKIKSVSAEKPRFSSMRGNFNHSFFTTLGTPTNVSISFFIYINSRIDFTTTESYTNKRSISLFLFLLPLH